MLRIPVETLPSVGPGSLPDARLSPNAPLDSFGGGAGSEAAFRAAQGLSQATSSFAMEAKNQDDLADVMGAVAKLHDAATDMQFNPQTGFLAKRGDQARDLQGPVREQYNKTVSDLSGTLRNDEQRLMFQKQANEKWAQVNGVLAAHTLQERQNYIGEQEGAIVNSSINAGAKAASIGDEKGLQDAVKTVESGLRASGALNGKPQETTDLTASIGVSKVYTEAIQSLLANGQDLSAKGLYDKYNGQMTENDKQRLAPHLLQGTTLGEAQRITSGLFSQAVDYTQSGRESGPVYATEKDLQDSIDAATKDASPLVKAKVEDMAIRRYNIEKTAQKETQDATYQKLADQVRQTGNLESAQASPDYLSLDENDKRQLEVTASRLAKGDTPYAKINDPRVVTKFDSLSKEDLASLSEADLMRRVPSVTEATFEKMSAAWKAARNKEDQAEFKITEQDRKAIFLAIRNSPAIQGMEKVKSQEDLLNTKNKDANAAYVEFKQEIENKLDAAAAEKPSKHLDQKERNQIINDAVIEKTVNKPQGFFRKYGAFGALFAGVSPVGAAASLAGYGYSRYKESGTVKVTDQERSDIRDAVIRVTGVEPSEEKIGQMKLAMQKGASKRLLERLAGE